MTDHTDLLRRLRRVHDVDCELHGDPCEPLDCTCSWVERKEAAEAIESLETDNAALRKALTHLEQAYSNPHSPQHRAAALGEVRALLIGNERG